MRSVIRFLNSKNTKPAEIDRRLCNVYVEYAMSSSVLRRWVRLFNEGRENVRDDPRSGRPSVAKRRFGWGTIRSSPPYSPDLAPSDFHLFLHLKSFLDGRRFHDDNVVKEAVTTCFASQAASFYDEGIQKLCPAMTSASTMVETMSKSSVRYVHQIYIYIYIYIQGVPGGMCQTSGECSLR